MGIDEGGNNGSEAAKTRDWWTNGVRVDGGGVSHPEVYFSSSPRGFAPYATPPAGSQPISSPHHQFLRSIRDPSPCWNIGIDRDEDSELIY